VSQPVPHSRNINGHAGTPRRGNSDIQPTPKQRKRGTQNPQRTSPSRHGLICALAAIQEQGKCPHQRGCHVEHDSWPCPRFATVWDPHPAARQAQVSHSPRRHEQIEPIHARVMRATYGARLGHTAVHIEGRNYPRATRQHTTHVCQGHRSRTCGGGREASETAKSARHQTQRHHRGSIHKQSRCQLRGGTGAAYCHADRRPATQLNNVTDRHTNSASGY